MVSQGLASYLTGSANAAINFFPVGPLNESRMLPEVTYHLMQTSVTFVRAATLEKS